MYYERVVNLDILMELLVDETNSYANNMCNFLRTSKKIWAGMKHWNPECIYS